jgi:centromeric protein E
VISKLTDGKATHIPFRDSKLTRLLQSSLSGQGRVSLICTVTPASSNSEETHNTLKFAHRAKRIEVQASQNKIIDEKSLIKKYQNEIRRLKEELEQLKMGIITGTPVKDAGEDNIILWKQKVEYLLSYSNCPFAAHIMLNCMYARSAMLLTELFTDLSSATPVCLNCAVD